MEQAPHMFEPIRDLNNHRTCDIRDDGKVVTIQRDGCLTIITARADGTLDVKFELALAA